MKSYPVKVPVLFYDLFHFLRELTVYFSPKQIMGICCRHFSCPFRCSQINDHTSSFICISSSASALKSSRRTGSTAGSSSRACTPNERRNSSVVPKSIGLPGASRRPSSFTSSYSNQLVHSMVAFHAADFFYFRFRYRLLIGNDRESFQHDVSEDRFLRMHGDSDQIIIVFFVGTHLV